MTCLLCGKVLSKRLQFWELLLLKRSSSRACRECLETFERIGERHCPTCYKSGVAGVCEDCQQWLREGKQISHQAIYCYNDAMKAYFSQYKFQGDCLLKAVFSADLRQALKAYRGYTLVPVPLSEERFAERQFNQVSQLLEAAKMPYQQFFDKKPSVKQSQKTRAERLKAEQVFAVKEGVTLPDKLLLVDDIYTTGATLQLLVSLCRENGVKDIKTFSLAR